MATRLPLHCVVSIWMSCGTSGCGVVEDGGGPARNCPKAASPFSLASRCGLAAAGAAVVEVDAVVADDDTAAVNGCSEDGGTASLAAAVVDSTRRSWWRGGVLLRQ